jgi:hypothetical protein
MAENILGFINSSNIIRNTLRIKSMGMEYSNGTMQENISGSGLMVKKIVLMVGK